MTVARRDSGMRPQPHGPARTPLLVRELQVAARAMRVLGSGLYFVMVGTPLGVRSAKAAMLR